MIRSLLVEHIVPRLERPRSTLADCIVPLSGPRAPRAVLRLLALFSLLFLAPLSPSGPGNPAGGEARAQDQGIWRVFLYGNEVQGLSARGDEIWAATNGGVLRLGPEGDFTQWNRGLHGLLSDSVSVIETDASGQVWCGTTKAGISVFDPEAERWRPLTTLLEPIPGNEIQRIRISGSAQEETVLVATSAGFAVFVGGELRSACQDGFDICPLPSYNVRDLVSLGGDLWIATDSGVTVEKANGSWEDRSLGLGGAHPVLLARADSLYSAGPGRNEIWTWRGNLWGQVGGLRDALPAGFQCRDLLARGDTLWVAGTAPSEGGVFQRLQGAWTRVGSAVPNVTSLTRTSSGRLYAGAADGDGIRDGIWEWTGSQWIQRRLDGPGMLQHYRSLLFDSSGVLWLASAQSGSVPRVIRYDRGRWSLFVGGLQGRLSAWTFRILEAGGDLWLGHCCCGSADSPENLCRLERVRGAGGSFEQWPINNARDLDEDDRGDIWVATDHDADVHAHGIYRLRASDSTFVQVSQEIEPRLVSNQIWTVRVDGRIVWIGYQESGVSRWDLGPDREPLTSDDDWRSFTESHLTTPIVGNAVRAMAIGSDHRVWIGTTAGLSIYDGTRFVNIPGGFGRLPTAEVTAVLPTDDGGGWVGTREGGLTHMTKRSLGGFNYEVFGSPFLPNPTIETMTFAPDGRTLWLGTARGLASFVPPRATGGTAAVETGVYPNPFVAGCNDGVRLIGITGSVRGVVTDLAGKLIAEFPKNGGAGALLDPGEVVWDGTHGGERVAPGLYWIRVQTPRGIKSIGVAVMDGDCP